MNKRKEVYTILNLRINSAGAVENGDILSIGALMNIIKKPITSGLDDIHLFIYLFNISLYIFIFSLLL